MTVDSYRPPSERSGGSHPGAAPAPPETLTGPAAAAHALRPDALGHAPRRRGRPPAGRPRRAPHPRGGRQRRRRRRGGRDLPRRGPLRHRELRRRGAHHGLRGRAGGRCTTISGLGVWPAARRPSSTSATAAAATCPTGSSAPSSRRRPTPGSPPSSASAPSGSRRSPSPRSSSPATGSRWAASSPGSSRPTRAPTGGGPPRRPSTCPGAACPRAGERFVQTDLARTLTYLADEDRAAPAGRPGCRARGGARRLLPGRRRGRHRALPRGGGRAPHARGPRRLPGRRGARRARPVRVPRGPDLRLLVPGAGVPPDAPDPRRRSTWCALGHNTPDYVHTVTEAMKLAFADREAYYGDPRHVAVPGPGLLDPAYAAGRRGLIDPARAWPEMPPPGTPAGAPGHARRPRAPPAAAGARRRSAPRTPPWSTARATRSRPRRATSPPTRRSFPARGWRSPRAAPRAGSIPATRARSRPASARGSRPVPPSCSGPGGDVAAFGTPGGDVQLQAMLQVLLNMTVFGMSPQRAIEAPRFATQSFPDSFWPHRYFPGRVTLEGRFPEATLEALRARGHEVAALDGRGSGARAACAWRGSTRPASAGAPRTRAATPTRWPGEATDGDRLAPADPAGPGAPARPASGARRPHPPAPPVGDRLRDRAAPAGARAARRASRPAPSP